MIFSGFQKLTLLDDPTHVSCTLFTQGCTLRCPFCHNSDLIDITREPSECITEEDVLHFLNTRRGILDSVSLTGGEPLMHSDLPSFLSKVKSAGFSVKLDTNGHFPERLKDLVSEGLVDRVAMDIKNCREKYAMTTGIPNLNIEPIEESAEFLMRGNLPFEFRTTVVAELHTESDMRKIAQWLSGDENYFLQAFVNSENVLCPGLHPAPKEEMVKFAKCMQPMISNVKLRGI